MTKHPMAADIASRSSADSSLAHAREGRWPGLAVLVAAAVCLWLAIASVLALMARHEWDSMMTTVQSTATTVSRLLAHHSDRLLENADLVRHQAAQIMGDTGPLVADRAKHDKLKSLLDISPAIVSVWIGDAEGKAVLTTREYPAPDLSAKDRLYYTTIRDDPGRLFIGNLLDNRYAAEALLINTSRRLSHPDGAMRGFVQVSIDPAPISETFEEVDIGFDASLWWIGPDGRALIREPALPLAELDEKAPLGHRTWPDRVPQERSASFRRGEPFRGVSGVDGEVRLLFWSDAPVYGSRIIVGVSYEAMVARWKERMTSTAALALVIGIAGMAILSLLNRARRRGLAYAVRLENDVSDRTRELSLAVEQKELIHQELEHRVRNAFATILALTRQLMRSSHTLEDFRTEFPERLEALARTNLLLLEARDDRKARISDLAHAALDPYQSAETQVTIFGPDVELSSERALGLGLILHELVTNAAKYGSLSVASGTLSVRWTVDADSIHLVWLEADGPAVAPPEQHGSGTRIIDRAAALFGGSFNRKFAREGVRVDLRIAPAPAR